MHGKIVSSVTAWELRGEKRGKRIFSVRGREHWSAATIQLQNVRDRGQSLPRAEKNLSSFRKLKHELLLVGNHVQREGIKIC